MMVPSAGAAVHAFYDFYLKNGLEPTTVCDDDMADYLKRLPDRNSLPDLTPVFLSHVRFCWQYLYELIQLADEHALEPYLPGRRNADMMLVHKRRFYVIETKCMTGKANVVAKLKPTKGKTQVQQGVAYLRHATRGGVDIYGHVLMFIFRPEQEPEVEWREVITLKAYPNLPA